MVRKTVRPWVAGLGAVVVMMLPLAGVRAMQGGQPPRAMDGRSLYDESPATQAMFITVWGEEAPERWVLEHNQELARVAPPAPPEVAMPPARPAESAPAATAELTAVLATPTVGTPGVPTPGASPSPGLTPPGTTTPAAAEAGSPTPAAAGAGATPISAAPTARPAAPTAAPTQAPVTPVVRGGSR